MKRWDFIKQATAAAAGIAVGAKLPVVDSGFPEIIGFDIAKGSDLAGAVEIFNGVVTRAYFGPSPLLNVFEEWKLAQRWELTLPEVRVLSVEEKADMLAFDHIQSILEEADKQTPWGKVMHDIMEQELTQSGICFDEAQEAFELDQDAFKNYLKRLATPTGEAKAAMEEYGIEWKALG